MKENYQQTRQLSWTLVQSLPQTPKRYYKKTQPGKMEKKLTGILDHFFTLLILIGAEEEYISISVDHIL